MVLLEQLYCESVGK